MRFRRSRRFFFPKVSVPSTSQSGRRRLADSKGGVPGLLKRKGPWGGDEKTKVNLVAGARRSNHATWADIDSQMEKVMAVSGAMLVCWLASLFAPALSTDEMVCFCVSRCA